MFRTWAILACMLTNCTAFQIQPSNDSAKLDEVQALADQYHFRYQWQEDVFDCADMSAANYQFLKDRGYHPEIAIRADPPNGSHCYVIFPVGDGWAGLDTQKRNLGKRSLDQCIGKVITDLDAWKICDTPEDLENADRSLKEGIRGPYLQDAIEAN